MSVFEKNRTRDQRGEVAIKVVHSLALIVLVVLTACTRVASMAPINSGTSDEQEAPPGVVADVALAVQAPQDELLVETQPIAKANECPPLGAPEGREAFSAGGHLNVVWNDQPHYIFSTEAGQVFELLLAEETAAGLGGPLTLNNSLVSVEGLLGCVDVAQVEVTSVEIQPAN